MARGRWRGAAHLLVRYSHSISTSTSQPPLSGIRVLDCTRILAGPFCTQALGDQGADVIKIEHPGVGDDTRRWGPPFWNDLSAYFIACNRNKRSVAIDLKSERGRAAVIELAAVSDVFVENFLPGKLDSMGLGYDVLAAINPRIVYASISGYGASGPQRMRAGYDVAAAAEGGLLSVTGPSDGPPCKTGVALVRLGRQDVL
jgi:succinate---hydroxymethylglutarate CoA-transferase